MLNKQTNKQTNKQINRNQQRGHKKLHLIFHVLDLIWHFPNNYQDRTRIFPIAQIGVDKQLSIEGKIIEPIVRTA